MTQFTVNAKDLSDALNLVLNSAEIKGTLPWLSYVLIEAQAGKLKLSGTDMDMSISLHVPAEIKTEGAFCVKAKQIADLMALLSGGVVITAENDQVWVKTETAKHRLPYLPKEEFRFIDVAADEKIAIEGKTLAGMLKAASIAMETNPNGQESWKNLELCTKGDRFQVTGMCGPRAATTSIPYKGEEFYALLPAKAVSALTAFVANSETVTLFLSENVLTARFGENEATFKLSSHKWGDWSPVVEAKCEHQININPEILLPALKRVLLASDRNRIGARVDFRLKNGQSDLFSQSINGEANEQLAFDCPTLNGDTLPIAIDGVQLLDLFRIVKGDMVWELSANHSALKFTPKEPLPFAFTYVQGKLRI